jgi:hypothetical protein
VIVVPGLFYVVVVWKTTGVSPYRCLYGDPACSLTVATWLLCCVTGLAFLAAYKAARWALRTYQIGFEALRVQNEALLLEQSRGLAERLTPTKKNDRRVQVHVKLTDGALELGAPERDDRQTFEAEDCEFMSLGRTAIIDAQAMLRVIFKDKRIRAPLSVPIGSIPAAGRTWVRLWIESEALREIRSFGWDESGASCTFADAKQELLFRPLPQRRPRAALVVPTSVSIKIAASPGAVEAAPVIGRPPAPGAPEPVGPSTTSGPTQAELDERTALVEPKASEEDAAGAAAAAAAVAMVPPPEFPRKGRAAEGPLAPPAAAIVETAPEPHDDAPVPENAPTEIEPAASEDATAGAAAAAKAEPSEVPSRERTAEASTAQGRETLHDSPIVVTPIPSDAAAAGRLPDAARTAEGASGPTAARTEPSPTPPADGPAPNLHAPGGSDEMDERA